MKKRTGSMLVLASLLLSVTFAQAKVKNVICLVPDGCDATVQTAARWYKGEELQLDKMKLGAMKIHMANSIITGSAAAATAFASGEKTTVRFLGIGASEDNYTNLKGHHSKTAPYAPMASILEAAKLSGKAVGLVSTSRITHATPAAFACHIQDRGWDNDIMEHLVYNNLTVAFGGGKRHLLTKDQGGKRTDGEDLLQVLMGKGYDFVETRDQLLALDSDKAWGMFASSHMDADMDRAEFNPTEPSIAEMTEKALEILAKDPDGFFIMIEGSQVDWAGHNNDPIYMVRDMIAFDDAVAAAVKFARENDNTLVVAFPDHNTGGMKIGHYTTPMPYTNTKIDDLVAPLKGMKITANGVIEKMGGDYSEANFIATVKEWWGLDITAQDVADITDYSSQVGWSYAMARILSERYTIIGWSTHGHNGEDVPVWSYGKDSDLFQSTMDNTDLAKNMAQALGVSLDDATQALYVDATEAFNYYTIDKTDAENVVLDIDGYRFPEGKSIAIKGAQTWQLPGLNVYAPATDKFYIAKAAVKYLKHLNVGDKAEVAEVSVDAADAE
ncbi:MAG: alkaline phosphatase [Chitinivibrionales bacterium]|nr:alkaline phosphatase [Chitinivibrionales bacterium]